MRQGCRAHGPSLILSGRIHRDGAWIRRPPALGRVGTHRLEILAHSVDRDVTIVGLVDRNSLFRRVAVHLRAAGLIPSQKPGSIYLFIEKNLCRVDADLRLRNLIWVREFVNYRPFLLLGGLVLQLQLPLIRSLFWLGLDLAEVAHLAF